jgi:hypothetical protein
MERVKGMTAMRARFTLAGVAALAALAVGCGGGGGGGSSPAAVSPATTAPSSTGQMQLYLVPASTSTGGPVVIPTGALGGTTQSVSFDALGQAQGVLVVEAGFTGTFTESVNGTTCNSGVTVTPTSASGKNNAVFVITAAAAGICSVTITDGTNVGSVLVDITTTTGSISSTKRN